MPASRFSTLRRHVVGRSAPGRSAALLATLTLLLGLWVVAGSAMAGPANAQGSPSWVPLADATIHPGVQTVTDGGQCTANFVFTDAAGEVYLGQAAHCASGDNSSATNGCEAQTSALGIEVEVQGASQPGTLVYSSWNTMQALGETDPNACDYNDLALVRIAAVDRAAVNPSLPFYGGPTGIIDSTASGDTVYTFGHSGLRPGSGVQKSGTSAGQSGDGWTHTVRTTMNPGIPGDSGSAFVDAQGRAFGVLSTLELFPNIGTNGVSDLSRMLAYLDTHGDLDVTLANGTLTFDRGGNGTDTATGSPGGPTDPPAGGATVDRLAGAAGTSRIETAAAVSRDSFGMASAGVVVLSRADVAADALAGTPLAARLRGPLLLTGSDALHPAAEGEISRVLPPTGEVILLGGEGALSANVAGQLRARGYRVTRLAGPSRIETALAVADRVSGSPGEILLADGQGFTDALVAGPAAHAVNGVVVLTDGRSAHPAVDAYLADHRSAPVTAIGDAAAAAYPSAAVVAGPSPEATSVLVAQKYLPAAADVGVARVDVFADALSGGTHIALADGPILLTPTNRLDDTVSQHLADRSASITRAVLYGGTGALSEQVAADVRAALNP